MNGYRQNWGSLLTFIDSDDRDLNTMLKQSNSKMQEMVRSRDSIKQARLAFEV